MQFNTNTIAHYAGCGGPPVNHDGSPSMHHGGGCHHGCGHSSHAGRSFGDRQGFSPRPPCQICGKTSHTAVRCWYRMHESYNEDPPSATVATTTSYKVDPNRYIDTGATDHITSDLDCLAVHERYHGGEVIKLKSATEQVCAFCILVIPCLILLLAHLHCIIFFICLIFPKIFFQPINSHVIMMYFLNVIYGISLLRINSHGKLFWKGDVSLASTPSSHQMLPLFIMHC
jgi:hypothetical protein